MCKHYDKEFKAKVAVEAIRGEKTIQEIATSHAVHPNLVSLWKKQRKRKIYPVPAVSTQKAWQVREKLSFFFCSRGFRKSLKHVAQVFIGVVTVRLRCFNEAIDTRACMGS